MKENPKKTRNQQHEIEIDAPIETVWRAITEAEELTRWLAENARVIPGVGGRIWVSWGEDQGEDQSGGSVIEVWEPNRRLRKRMGSAECKPDSQSDAEAATTNPMIQEYVLERKGNRTVLRLVHSGIPDSPDWEGFYESTNRGWQLFFLGLRHYLHKHRGVPRKNVVIWQPITVSMPEAWQRLTGADGLGLGDQLAGPASLSEANQVVTPSRYEALSGLGEKLAGEVLLWMPPKTLVVTVESLNDALLSATLEEAGGANYIYVSLATFGLPAEEFPSLQERWSNWLGRMFAAN